MIEDVIIDILELSETKTYNLDSLAVFVGNEIDEDSEYIKQIISEMIEDKRLTVINDTITITEESS